MRRQGGHYGGGGGDPYGGGGGGGGEKDERRQNQWRWERDANQSKLTQPAAVSATDPFAAQGQGRDAPRSYYQNQRMDQRIPPEKQGGGDPRSQPHEEDMEIGYEDDRGVMNFEGLEQRFVDDIMKLSKEQTDAEDAEIARHRERINAINKQFDEQLAALRARHASQREDFLRRESHGRKQQYHQHQQQQQQQQHLPVENYPNSNMGPPSDARADPRGFNAGATPEPNRAYSSEHYPADSYRERGGRFPVNNARDHGYEPKVPYPRGRAYNTSSRYY